MLKTRRQIRTEEDRLGGYSPTSVSYDSERNRFNLDEHSDAQYYYEDLPMSRQTRESEQESVVRYSRRNEIDSAGYRDTAEYVGESYSVRPVKKSARRDAESIMPSLKTRVTVKENKEEVKERNKSSMAPKMKVMLGVYAAIVVILAAIVIATGIAIGNMGTSVEALQDEISYRNEVVAMQNAELSTLDNEYAILGHATELGMTRPSSVREVELLPMKDTVKYEARTNWFDKFCDWLSNLIGG